MYSCATAFVKKTPPLTDKPKRNNPFVGSEHLNMRSIKKEDSFANSSGIILGGSAPHDAALILSKFPVKSTSQLNQVGILGGVSGLQISGTHQKQQNLAALGLMQEKPNEAWKLASGASSGPQTSSSQQVNLESQIKSETAAPFSKK